MKPRFRQWIINTSMLTFCFILTLGFASDIVITSCQAKEGITAVRPKRITGCQAKEGITSCQAKEGIKSLSGQR